ncbi:MAG: hypothetical protein ACOH1O_07945 [Flavobacterium sp.]
MIFCQLTFAQDAFVKGKIIADALPIEGVEVINLVTKESTTSDKQGLFSIKAQEDHLLVFYDKRLDYMRHSISREDLTNLFTIKMTFKVEELEEVVVNNYSHINAVSLGIVKPGFVMPTKRERLMRSSGGGIFTVVNEITGQAKDLRTALDYSRKDENLDKLQRLNLRSYYTKSFGVAADYHEDFERFLIEDATFISALKSEHKHRVLFQMARLAVDYNEIMKNEVK